MTDHAGSTTTEETSYAALEARIHELETDLAEAQERLAAYEEPSAGANRTAQILRLAEEQAREVRDKSVRDAGEWREQARRDAAALRAEAEREIADLRVHALAEVDERRQRDNAELTEQRRVVAAEADELVASVWWMAERVRLAAGQEARDLPASVREGAGQDREGVSRQDVETATAVSQEEQRLARDASQRRMADAAEQAHRTRQHAEADAERIVQDARKQAEERLAQARAEAAHILAESTAERERAWSQTHREVEALSRQRDGIVTRLTELTRLESQFDDSLAPDGVPRQRTERERG